MITLAEIDQQIADALGVDPDPTILRVMRVAKSCYRGMGLSDRITDLAALPSGYLAGYVTDEEARDALVAWATAHPEVAVAGPPTEAEIAAEAPPE